MLVHAYLGALVFGAVLLAASLLVGKRGRLKVRSLGFWGFVLAFFGLTTIALRMAGLADERTTALVGVGVGFAVGALVLFVGRREKAR